MAGDDRVRHCVACDLNVYNFAAMTHDEVSELIARTEGRLCARLYRRPDGTILTRDCPVGLRALRRRASRAVAAIIAALLSLPAFAFGRATKKKCAARVTLSVETVSTQQAAVFTGVVVYDDGVLPGVTVHVRNESTGADTLAITDARGVFNVASLSDGIYRVDAELAGFKKVSIKHLELKSGEVTSATIPMQMDQLLGEVIIVGSVAPLLDPRSTSITTTFTRVDFDLLP